MFILLQSTALLQLHYILEASCFCQFCHIGQFCECFVTEFNRIHHTNLMDNMPVEFIPDQIDFCLQMRDQMSQLPTSYGNPYLFMLFESRHISRPIFTLISPGANFNVAIVCGHILDPLNASLNYFNNCQVKVPVDGLCQLHNHSCTKKHTQLALICFARNFF